MSQLRWYLDVDHDPTPERDQAPSDPYTNTSHHKCLATH
jgi:hypothetical protein